MATETCLVCSGEMGGPLGSRTETMGFSLGGPLNRTRIDWRCCRACYESEAESPELSVMALRNARGPMLDEIGKACGMRARLACDGDVIPSDDSYRGMLARKLGIEEFAAETRVCLRHDGAESLENAQTLGLTWERLADDIERDAAACHNALRNRPLSLASELSRHQERCVTRPGFLDRESWAQYTEKLGPCEFDPERAAELTQMRARHVQRLEWFLRRVLIKREREDFDRDCAEAGIGLGIRAWLPGPKRRAGF